MSVQDLPPAMGVCDITGKSVPEDELVTIGEHRVCAEGKAILLQRLQAGEALPGERERPRILQRFGCIFVDGLILGIPFMVINLFVTRTYSSTLLVGVVSLISTTVQIIYFGQLHGTRGQTVGKMAGKLIVVKNSDGSPITLSTAYVRAFAYVGPSLLTGFSWVLVGLLTGPRTTPAFVIPSAIGVLVALWQIISIILALVDSARQRTLHDLIAGTRVVVKE